METSPHFGQIATFGLPILPPNSLFSSDDIIIPYPAPKSSWKNAEEVFKDSLAHEQAVTKSIDKLYALARKENDYAAEIFLQWFVTEQIEEEENVTEIIDKIKLLGVTNSASMYLLDKELGARG